MLPATMTSLPIPATLSELAAVLTPDGEHSRSESEQHLLRAFRWFAEAADSLERSYGMLRAEVARLNGELERSNAGLARSVEDNRRMREHLDRIVEGLPCGVLAAKSNGEITLLNPEARRLLDFVAEPTVIEDSRNPVEKSKRFSSLLLLPNELRNVLERAQQNATEQEHCLDDGDGAGEEQWIAVRHAAVGCPSGDAEAHDDVFILRDVSDTKRLARERDQLRREQALVEMSAVLAHEIRNPLGSLELFAGLLADSALPEQCRHWVGQVQAGLRTLAATVNNVLHFHSLPPPERMALDLGQLLDWTAGFLSPVARQARVQLCLRNSLQGVQFSADRHRMEQVLLNLVLNALRAMPGGGWVEIIGRPSADGAATISISDTGPGILAKDVERIFEPGFSTRPGSPGLGLAVSRKIVEQHGGVLVAANRAGAGASFTLTLPLEECPAQSLAQEVAG